MSRLQVPIRDYHGKVSTVDIPVDAYVQADAEALVDALIDLVVGLTNASQHVEETPVYDAVAGPVSALATRNTKWLVHYQDSVDGSEHNLEIPTADLTLQSAGSNVVDLTAGPGLAFKTAFEAFALSPVYPGQGGGNAVTLTKIEYVPRKLKVIG